MASLGRARFADVAGTGGCTDPTAVNAQEPARSATLRNISPNHWPGVLAAAETTVAWVAFDEGDLPLLLFGGLVAALQPFNLCSHGQAAAGCRQHGTS